MRGRQSLGRLLLAGIAASLLGGLGPAAFAKDPPKEKPRATPAAVAKPGISKLETPAPVKYCLMAAPKDYDASKWYPLALLLHQFASDPAANKPEPWVDLWAPELNKRGW